MSGKEVRAMLEANLQVFEDEAFKRGESTGEMKGRNEAAIEHAKKTQASGSRPRYHQRGDRNRF